MEPLFHVWSNDGLTRQPAHVGDLLRVKDLGYRWSLTGMPFLVLDILEQDRHYIQLAEDPKFVVGLLGGELCVIRIEDLETCPDL
jgi:hypothetical protein